MTPAAGGYPLYCCHTMYHVLIALVRAMRQRQNGGTLASILLADTIPGCEALADRLRRTGQNTVWGDVLTVEEAPLDAQNSESAFYRLRHLGHTPYFSLPAGAQVYLCNDWSAVGRYLQRQRIPYTLCEDTVGGTLDPDQHLLDAQRAAPDFAARRKGKGYLYWGDSPCCVRVESEDAARCTLFPPEKLVTFSKKALLESLTPAEKAAVRAVFLTRPLPDDPAALADATLLLPRSFVADGLMTQAEQNAMFAAVAAKYADGPLYIKTHPRDETDYGALFPDAVILERTMPSEVLNFCLPGKFKRAVTVQSWVLRGFTAAQENVFIGLEEAKQMIPNRGE